MKTNSNFFCFTPIFRVHSVLFFRVTKNRYKNRITIIIQTVHFKIALLRTHVLNDFYRARTPARDFLFCA